MSVILTGRVSCNPVIYTLVSSVSIIMTPCVQILLETGEIGRQANGAVMLTCGKTVSCCLSRGHTAAAYSA